MAETADAKMTDADWRAFPSREALAETLARDIADALEAAVVARGAASLAVSGGSTPGLLFDALSRMRPDWPKALVTLVDERFVPPSSGRSNERLVRERLLRNEARLARFLPLYAEGRTIGEAAGVAEAALALNAPRLDVAVLGMGTDGHTASFFPDAPNLDALTDPDQPRRVMPVETASGGEPRLTLTMPVLAGAGFLALHIEGEVKRAVLERALGSSEPRLPIARVADAAPHLKVYWAP